MTLNSKGFSRLITIVCAFVLPTLVLLYLHFVQGSGSGTQFAIVAVVLLACVAVAIRAAYAELTSLNELEWKVEGIRKTRHIFEYKPDGTIVYVNPKSLELLGYKSEQIVGRHHSMLIAPEETQNAEYRELWSRLARGESVEKRHTRKSASGKDIHVISRYTPIYGLNGKVCKVIDWLTDLTSAHQEQSAIVEPLAAGLKKLAEGDLTTRITNKLQGEYDELRVNFNAALDRLQDTVCKVLRDASNISTGAAEISQAADDLSRRTEQQAASLEETAAALEEITATVKSTATNARDARASVTTAKSVAEEGGRVVETAIHAMDSISQSSKKITDIIGVIDEIAFQTNLLALNAGVEAARAGDAGKGFAVVASEVRALAQRSSEAAKEIKTLIHAAGEQVESGVKFVGESGSALNRIVEQVVQINALVSEMAMAAEQQSTGIEEVNSAVTQMDQVTQQNAAMVEQSTAASRQLADEAQSLSQSVSFFRAAQQTSSVVARPRSASQVVPSRVHSTNVMKPANTRRAASAVAAKPKVDPDDWTEF